MTPREPHQGQQQPAPQPQQPEQPQQPASDISEPNGLSPEEAAELTRLEAEGDAVMAKAGAGLGAILLVILAKRLYRGSDGRRTFEQYCPERWGRSDKWAYNLVQQQRINQSLAEAG